MPPCDLLSPRLSGQYCLSTHTRPYTFNGCLFCIQAYSALFCTPIYGLSARSTPSQYSQLHILHWFWSLILTPSSYLAPTPTVPYFTITYQYHIRHSSPYTQLIFLPYMVFECRHNIRNQPLSTAIPSPSSLRDITMLRKYHHLGDTFFPMF